MCGVSPIVWRMLVAFMRGAALVLVATFALAFVAAPVVAAAFVATPVVAAPFIAAATIVTITSLLLVPSLRLARRTVFATPALRLTGWMPAGQLVALLHDDIARLVAIAAF